MKNQGIAGVYAHRVNILKQMPVQMGKIIMLGNSLTEQGQWSELLQNPDVLNRGIAGDLTNGVLDRLDGIVASKPTKIFLMIGINDLLFHSPSQILSNYEQIIQRITTESPETALYCQSLLPVNDLVRRNGMDLADILAINQGIEQLTRQYQVTYINLHPLFTDSDGRLKAEWTKDGIHLDAPAYKVWKEALTPYF